VRIPLRSVVTRTTLLAGVGLLTAGYGFFAFSNYRAYRLSNQLQSGTITQALALEPRNAEYHDLLGSSLLLVDEDPKAAIVQYNFALHYNPYDSRYWVDLARAYLVTGDLKRQEEALQQAVAVDPTTPSIAWEVGNFFLARGETSRALELFKVVLRNDPQMVRPALELCWRATGDVQAVVAALPRDPVVYLEFLRLLTEKNNANDAAYLWERTLALKSSFEPRQAVFYVDYLLERKQYDLAQRAWKQLATVNGSFRPYLGTDGLVVNGGFTEPILNGGFDWRYTPASGAVLSLDTNESHGGNQSLSIRFDGAPNDNSGIHQFVLVEPGSDYELSAWVKSEEIASANGPLLGLFDPYDNSPVATTKDFVGTSPWQQVQKRFRTGANTHLLDLRIARLPGTTLVRGRLWVDEISVRPVMPGQ
jgi:tetratricopeptide (TPR) repeat protein